MAKKNAIDAKRARILRKAVAHILEEPRRYDQNEPIVSCGPGEKFVYSVLGAMKAPRCRTIGCLAGWITIQSLGLKKSLYVNPIDFAADKLNLDSFQTDALFGEICEWPEKFAKAYHNAKTPRAVAKVAQRRVEHFIKTSE